MNVFFVHNKPFSKEEVDRDRTKLDKHHKWCLKNRTFGMGWNDDSIIVAKGTVISDDVIKEINIKSRGFKQAQKLYNTIQVNDVVMTRLDNKYYVGKVNSRPRLSDNARLTWAANVEDWIEYEDIPHHVWGAIQSATFRKTIGQIEGLAAITIRKVVGDESIGSVNIDNFHLALGPNDLEDLMADYMLIHNNDYIFLPSSCKTNTPGIEFVMYNPQDGKMITCQTKVNAVIDESKYASSDYDKYERIYLFSGIGYTNKSTRSSNRVTLVKREDMFQTLKNNKYFKDIVEKYFKFE